MTWLSRGLVWCLVLMTGAICLLIWLPARWLTPTIERASQGQLQLTEVAGTLWDGSAQVSLRPAAMTTQTAMVLPERLSWTLHKTPLLFARAEGFLRFGGRPASLFSAGLKTWSLAAGATALPAAQLIALGAPLNSMGPGGWVDLAWSELNGSAKTAKGQLTARWSDATTRLSGNEPLGDYLLTIEIDGAAVRLNLITQQGRLQVTGNGQLAPGTPPRFRLVSKSAAEQRERLSTVLNMLGRRQNDEYILQIGS